MPFSRFDRAVSAVGRGLVASVLTAIVGAVERWGYDGFSVSLLDGAGPLVFGAIWLIAWSVLFAFAGLLVLGLPTAHLLHRSRIENPFSLAVAGAIAGALWGFLTGLEGSLGSDTTAFYGCMCALFWWVLRPKT